MKMEHLISGKVLVFCGLLCLLSDVTSGQVQITTKPTTKPPITIKPQTLYFVIAAKNLPGKDTNKKLDPFVKVYLGTAPIKSSLTNLPSGLKKVDKSDVLKNNVNPEWYRVFSIQWTQGKNQKIYLEIQDYDLLATNDVVGYAAFDLDDYVQRGQEVVTNLHMASYFPFYSSNGKPEISVRKTETFYFTLAARNLPKRDEFNSKSDPFVECYVRKGKEGFDLKFFSTPVINNEENPNWGTILFSHYQRDNDQYFHFKVMDHDTVTPNDQMGEVLMPVDPFVGSTEAQNFTLEEEENSYFIISYLNK